jgi:transcriptional regulator with XRE-family HTH domain
MTYTIPPGTPKAVKAAAFGRELVKARTARGIPRKELHRVTGIGINSLIGYEAGATLPKLEAARALAETLRWPRLAEMIVAARTFTCARTGCQQTFRNDTGAPRRYCSADCQQVQEQLRKAAAANRAAGRAGVWSSRDAAATKSLRAGLAIADERVAVLTSAIEAMCAGCEPEGLCRTPECPLRAHSPLPLATHDAGDPRTLSAIRRDTWTPDRRERFVAALHERWDTPGAREAAAEQMRRYHAEHPEHADLTRAGVRRRDERRRALAAGR